MELTEKSPIQRDLESLDGLVHDPRRLAILNILSGDLESTDYTQLRSITGLTTGNLSRHLARLEEAGFVELQKEFVLRRPTTRISITREGAAALEKHWITLQRLREDAQQSRAS